VAQSVNVFEMQDFNIARRKAIDRFAHLTTTFILQE
jgi:hypothetical protein